MRIHADWLGAALRGVYPTLCVGSSPVSFRQKKEHLSEDEIVSDEESDWDTLSSMGSPLVLDADAYEDYDIPEMRTLD